MKIYLSPSDQTGNLYSAGNTNEAVVCRKIAQAAGADLERNGYEVMIGAEGTTYQQRTAQSNAWGADVHMPIHTNAGGGDGTVVFAYPASVDNKYVQGVYRSVAAVTPGADDGVRAVTNLYEINNSRGVCVYLECEFHDDPKLAQWIIDHTGELGEAIAKGCCSADGRVYAGPDESFVPGGRYRLLVDNYIRTEPSGGYRKYKDLTASAKRKVVKLSGSRVKLKKGNVVEALEVFRKPDGDIWIRIKNGWLCAVHRGVYRLEKI